MSRKILVIDDEEGIRDAFSMALEDLGYEVHTAANGEEGSRLAREVVPALVFLDLKMPGISGVETLRRLLREQPELEVWIVTGFFPEFMHELRQAAADGLCFELARKPMERDQIQLVARRVLEGWRGEAGGVESLRREGDVAPDRAMGGTGHD